MKKMLLGLLVVGFSLGVQAQSLTLKKGTIIENIKINDSISENFSLYLPTSFEVTKTWPIVFVFDHKGRSKQAIQMFLPAAEKNGYILAAPNHINDSLTISDNVLITSRMMNKIFSILPINNQQIYTAGFAESSKFASILPVVINNIQGVLTINGSLANTDVLNVEKMFHYIGVVDVNNENLTEMQVNEKVLNTLRYPNQLFVYYQGVKPTMFDYINSSFEIFTLGAMSKNTIPKDANFIQEKYLEKVALIEDLIKSKHLIQSYDLATEIIDVYRPLVDVDNLKELQKSIKKDRVYKDMKRSESAILFKESLMKEDFDYAMYEDIENYNFNNLGWWKFQMQELEKQNSKDSIFKNQMNSRLKGFVNFLVDKNIEALKAEKILDEEGLVFLWMLKTITNPKDFDAYKNVISLASKNEDYGTSLFYLEELLKMGYSDKKLIYEIENTALLRITPEFNELVEKYLKEARYMTIEQ